MQMETPWGVDHSSHLPCNLEWGPKNETGQGGASHPVRTDHSVRKRPPVRAEGRAGEGSGRAVGPWGRG